MNYTGIINRLKDFRMTDAEFNIYQEFIHNACGINLSPNKKKLLMSRLSIRMKALKIPSFRTYYKYVIEDKSRQELMLLIDAISTNKSEFFRDVDHFELLRRNIYPSLLKQQKVRIWSVGCSSGEEPYAIAMTILEILEKLIECDIKILATDISNKVLDEAESGIYNRDMIFNIPVPLQEKYFLKGVDDWSSQYLANEELKSLIRFQRLNLMEEFPLTTRFDVIFCRNVMSYFDKPTKTSLIEKFSRQLNPGGYLLIGQSESLNGINTNLKYVQPSVYQLGTRK